MKRGVIAVLMFVLLAPRCLAAGGAAPGSVKVLDDYESGRIKWTGDYQGAIVEEYATHGSHALSVLFQKSVEYSGITAAEIDLDWGGYDTLKVDVYNPQVTPVNLTVRIDDDESTGYSSRYNGEFLLANGQTFLEIPFSKIRGSDRPLDFSHVKLFTMFMPAPTRDATLYFDNIRLTRGEEPPETRGRVIASPAEDTPEIKALGEKAAAARSRLAAAISLAHERRLGTLEANIALVTADLGLDVRPKLKWYENRKGELYDYVLDSCDAAYAALEDALAGRRAIAPVPPIYDSRSLRTRGPWFTPRGSAAAGAPVLIFSMLYERTGPLCEYFTPIDYFANTHSFAGASRYDVEETPLYKAFKEYPDTRRVWNADEGWCGHIVRDSASMGGGSAPVVVCLESPRTRDAIAEYIRRDSRKWKDDPSVRVNVMGGELSYICYCKYTLDMFRAFLQDKYREISDLNSVWGTSLASFGEIDTMPNAGQAGENRARWYDWQVFNCYRFVEHAKWAKGIIRAVAPDMPVSVGSVSYSLRADFGRSGADEENLIRQVDDVVSNEAGPSTITTDLLRSLCEGAKPIVDFEYHGDVAGILPHFLHGDAGLAMWWWPDAPDPEFPQFNETALPYSWNIPLPDVAEALKIALDVRRIGEQVAAFAESPAEIAILYSRASMLQVPPEFASATDTPYTLELKRAYSAALGLDAPVRFISSLQVEEGKLSDVKLLIVPAAAYAFDAEAEAIMKFVQSGGSAVVIPDSLMFDEYARPRPRLAALGVSVAGAQEPSYTVGAAKRNAFLQGLERETSAAAHGVFMAFGKTGVLPEGAVLEGAGVFQSLSLSGDARATAMTADGAPALVEIPRGKGMVYYLAVPLVPESLNTLLDAVAERAGVTRAVRFALSSGGRDWRIEARAVEAASAMLFYVTNRLDKPATVSVSLPFEPGDAIDLRDPWREVNVARIEVAPGRTRICAVRQKAAR